MLEWMCVCACICADGYLLLPQEGWTALHLAAVGGSVEVVKELVAGGCAINAANEVRQYPTEREDRDLKGEERLGGGRSKSTCTLVCMGECFHV